MGDGGWGGRGGAGGHGRQAKACTRQGGRATAKATAWSLDSSPPDQVGRRPAARGCKADRLHGPRRGRACEHEAMSASEEPRLGAHATSRTCRLVGVGVRVVGWGVRVVGLGVRGAWRA